MQVTSDRLAEKTRPPTPCRFGIKNEIFLFCPLRREACAIHQRETQPMLLPFVEEFQTAPHNLAWYIDKLFKAQKALPASEVDKLLKERNAALEEEATKPVVVDEYHD